MDGLITNSLRHLQLPTRTSITTPMVCTSLTCTHLLFINSVDADLLSWAGFWGKVAQEFADNEYILGYELINEPWAGKDSQPHVIFLLSLSMHNNIIGDIYQDPLLLVPGVADVKVLAPAYEVVGSIIYFSI